MGALRFSPLQSERQLKKGERPFAMATACLANEALSAPAPSHLSELQNVALELTRKKVNDSICCTNGCGFWSHLGLPWAALDPKPISRMASRLWIAKFPAQTRARLGAA